MKARSRLWKIGAIAAWCVLAFIGMKFVQPKMRSVWPGWVNEALDGNFFGEVPDESPEIHARVDMGVYRTALLVYRGRLGRCPTQQEGLDALIRGPNLAMQGWTPLMEKLTPDPWGRPFQYVSPHPATPIDPNSYDLFSLGPDGMVSGDDVRAK